MLNHIVIPLDGSNGAERALAYGIEIASHHNARVSLVIVVPSYELVTLAAAKLPGAAELEAHHRRLAQEYVDQQVQALQDAGLTDVKGVLRSGDARQEINDYAQLIGADLIIVSTHGLSAGVGGVAESQIMGSTALKILMTAPCPVLLVRSSLPLAQPEAPMR
jgi:nucleotide-binding universal stress UspA family protein